MAEPRATQTGGNDGTAAKAAITPEQTAERRARVPADIRNVSFPVGMRGYDRAAVDAYVKRVNRVIAELEVTRSPQAAVRHAVEQVSEQTKSILEEARESAEQITNAAQEEADSIIAAAKAEAAELVVSAGDEAVRVESEAEQLTAQTQAEAEQLTARTKAEAEEILARANAEAEALRKRTDEELAAMRAEAEARKQELSDDTEAVRKEREALLDDIERMATQLHDAASSAAARFSRPSEPEPEPDEWPTDGDQTVVLTPEAAAQTIVPEPAEPPKSSSPARKKS